jgi:hypothetical protein
MLDELLSNMTKAKKADISKQVKKIMSQKKIDYEEWHFSKDLDYLLNNLDALSAPTKKQPFDQKAKEEQRGNENHVG